MIYLLDKNLKIENNLYIELEKIYGINTFQSTYLCKKLGFTKNVKLKKLSETKKLKLIEILKNSDIKINANLKKSQSFFRQNLIKIKSYRGIRCLKGYPVRGQRTHTNAKTIKSLKKNY